MTATYAPLNPTPRILLGPGPSNVPPAVYRAMSAPLVGHLDPEFVALMEEVKQMLREVMLTKNATTFPVSGTGSAGMEFCCVNLIEPSDEVLICVNGVFGARMTDVAQRCGAQVATVQAPWGRIIEPEAVATALKEMKAPKLVGIVHAETSTGVRQPMEEIARIAHDHGALLLMDCVTSLGGCPVRVDDWQVDAAYSGTQKCLSCPPGLAPVTFGARALEKATKRRTKAQSWYLDLNLLAGYWGQDRVYHHTAPVTMNYALREALRLVLEEGLEKRWARHEQNHYALKAGLEAIGLKLASQEGHQLWQLNSVTIPAGVDDATVRRRLLQRYNIEIGGGLGEWKGKTWRVGLMGESSREENVMLFLAALGNILNDFGCRIDTGAALSAASAVYRQRGEKRCEA
ncbi:MAG: alanine--glyoxylate aminotransferase family protein [Verrucomicrobiae bacterium]|nr:alanine--glyoxylate aminotransferase family protein [Verrucomicrobiae bacterium]